MLTTDVLPAPDRPNSAVSPEPVENCACKAKTEVKLADPAFKQAVTKKQPYDRFPFGDPADYQRQVLTDCPALRPLMIQAMCNDPAAPPDACTAVKDMVSKLK